MGRGRVRFQQGLFPVSIERSCSKCFGTGKLVTHPCEACGGAGLVALARQQAEANHWHMPNRPHGHPTALFEDCPHPDCVAARVDLGDLLEGASERDAIATLLSDRDEPGTYAKVEGLLTERRAQMLYNRRSPS